MSSRGGPWVRFFPSDWLAGTRGMTAAETGIYITLIAMMYERGKPVANDAARLARLCGTTPAAMKATITTLSDDGKLVITDEGLWNGRVGVETEIRREKSTQAGESAKTRWQKAKENQQRNHADALPLQSDGNANQKPDIRRRDTDVSLFEREFNEQFWPLCPRKVGKPKALRAFIAARKRAQLDAILAGMGRYADERRGQDQQFTKQPEGWLNRDGWLDEPLGPQPRGSPASNGRPVKGADAFFVQADELDERAREVRSKPGDWDDAGGIPILTIEHRRQ